MGVERSYSQVFSVFFISITCPNRSAYLLKRFFGSPQDLIGGDQIKFDKTL